jgi:hypothetical protein
MKRLQQVLLMVFALYLLYLAKSALGIELSHQYSAWKVFKLPIHALTQATKT